ncbi:DNA phosphorothioation-associated putative methyltransferase [Myxococcota bacterium]|nr:DNA phosphorothioation-associated putative methyltransferase [Myxococcota bacterium]
MEKKEYISLVEGLLVGKRVRGAVYMHRDALSEASASLQDFLWTLAKRCLKHESWSVVRLGTSDHSVSFLDYPRFFEDAFPSLLYSTKIELGSLSVSERDYSASENPFILHRKETMLPSTHHAYQQAKENTDVAENHGCFEETAKIGRQNAWLQILQKKGLEVRGDRIVLSAQAVSPLGSEPVLVDRHKTAIKRSNLSRPMQLLEKFGLLKGEHAVFDYGCGQGDDLQVLALNGINAAGWDPVYQPLATKQPSDIVNLGFVLNVIENPQERKQALLDAYSLSQRLFVVSVMLGKNEETETQRRYRDGVLTSRNTFQKYYSQDEFRQYLSLHLEEEPIAAGPGIFFIFKDKLLEQDILLLKQRGHSQTSILRRPTQALPSKRRDVLIHANKELLQDFWQHCVSFGRLPFEDEFAHSDILKKKFSSFRKAHQICSELYDPVEFEEGTELRKSDLLVFSAINLILRRKPYKTLSQRAQRDVKAFFSTTKELACEAEALLHSLADTSVLEEQCGEAYRTFQIGFLEEHKTYTFPRDLLELLEPVLRIYVGCAAYRYGDLEMIDLIKIHFHSRKVSFMRYDDFHTKAIPLLQERIKVNLRTLETDIFTHGELFPPSPLYHRSMYLTPEHPQFEAQKAFEFRLSEIIPIEGYGPSWRSLQDELCEKGYKIEGLEIKKLRSKKKPQM